MSIVAELGVPADDFLLDDTIAAAPSVEIDMVRIVCGPIGIAPYLWASGPRVERFADGLDSDETVSDVSTLTTNTRVEGTDAEERLFHISWDGHRDCRLLTSVEQCEGAVLHASYAGEEEWALSILLPDESALSTLHDRTAADGIEFELRRVYGARPGDGRDSFGITPEQREALHAAFESGYFEVPRDHTLSDIADDLDISANALSARLRRGFRTLVANTLIEE